MSTDPCQDYFDELVKAGEEWSLWITRATLPPSLKTAEGVVSPSIVLNDELIELLKENKKKSDEAWKKYLKAIDSFMECRKNTP